MGIYNVLKVPYLGKISDIIGNDITVLPREHLYSIIHNHIYLHN